MLLSRLKPVSFRNGFDDLGLTLIEIIVALVVVSILSAFVLNFLRSGLAGSVDPVVNVADLTAVGSSMERITIEYKKLLLSDTTPLATLKTAIGSEGSMQSNIFGSYEVVTNAYIDFNAGNSEIPDSTGLFLLKVKIRSGNRSLTALFTE